MTPQEEQILQRRVLLLESVLMDFMTHPKIYQALHLSKSAQFRWKDVEDVVEILKTTVEDKT